MTNHRLVDVFRDVGRGVLPPADGEVEVVSAPPGWSGAICAFTAHTIVAATLPGEEIVDRLPDDDLGAPMSPVFQSWLGAALGDKVPGVLDAVLVAAGTGEGKGALRRTEAEDHPRVRRAGRLRDDLSVWAPTSGGAVVCLGRGLADRWEVAVEVEPVSRDRGLGRQCIRASLGLVPVGNVVFAQVSPGNAASLRAFLSCGFRPIGSEVLFGRGGVGVPAERRSLGLGPQAAK